MIGFGLRKNTAFKWDGVVYRVDRIQANGAVLLERQDDGHFSTVSKESLLQKYFEGRISACSIGITGAVACAEGMVFSRPLDELPEGVRIEAVRRRHYLLRIFEDGRPVFSKAHLDPVIQQIASEIADSRPPSSVTLWRWYRRYRQTNDTRALIPRHDRRGSRNLKQSSRVLELAAEAIEDAFKASPGANVLSIYDRLLSKIDLENRQRTEGNKLLPPSLRTMYRMLGKIEAYQQVLLREGKVVANKRFRLVKRGVRTTNILERVEIDHTPLDIFLIDEKTWLPLGRPTLTVVLDHYSRMLLGYYISFSGPSTAAVMGALRHAILPKQRTEEAVPQLHIVHDWPCYGVPDEIVVDNGLEFHSDALESVAFDLGMRIQYCPKHEPRFKGSVERFLKTFNYSFAHQLPGTSFAHLSKRGDYDPTKHALFTLSEFKHILQKWVLDVYSQAIHRGLETTPWARWHEGLQRQEPELPSNVHKLHQRIGEVRERILRPDGILFQGIRYNGDNLEPILRVYGPGVKVRIVYNPDDLGDIYVWGPDQTDPVNVQALDQSRARGVTERQNDLIRKIMREKGQADQDLKAYWQARQELSESVDNLLSSRKQRDRRRAAAIRGDNSNKPSKAPRPSNKSKEPISKNAKRDLPEHLRHIDALLKEDIALNNVLYPILRPFDLRKEAEK